MTDGKKSFILHNDYQDYFALLSREERGDLIMAVFDYNRNGVLPDFDGSILMAFTMIRNQIERDALRYEARCERNKENIAKRWKEKDTTVYDGKSGKGSYTKHTDNGNDTDNVNDNVNDNANVNDIPKGIYISSVQQELDDGRETVDLNEAFDKAYQKYPRRDGKAKGKQLYMQYLKGRDIKGQGKVKFNHHQIYIANCMGL